VGVHVWQIGVEAMAILEEAVQVPGGGGGSLAADILSRAFVCTINHLPG
jgi:hypothetical protein